MGTSIGIYGLVGGWRLNSKGENAMFYHAKFGWYHSLPAVPFEGLFTSHAEVAYALPIFNLPVQVVLPTLVCKRVN